MALKLALDTNRYRDLCDGKREVVERIERAEAVFLPFVVVAELRAGFAAGSRGRANERHLQRFLAKPGVLALYPSDATTRAFAEIHRQLRAKGTPIPTHDLWIAALAVEHGLALYTRDEHFRRLPQLYLLD